LPGASSIAELKRSAAATLQAFPQKDIEAGATTWPMSQIRRRIVCETLEEKKVDNTAAGHSETKAMPQGKAAGEKKVRVDRFAEARRAKKKAKRMRHRAKLKRSHTKG
jgi:hypothetical protein